VYAHARGDDAETIAGFLAGDAEATRRVDDWLVAAATAFRRRLGADWDDVLQEARIEAIRLLRAGSFRGEASLKTYLWRVVGHACLRRLRRQARQPVTGEDLEARPTAASSPLERVLQRESAELLLRIFAAMPEACRELWRMIVDGLDYQEMSERTGVAPGALRVRVLRCRRRAVELRAELLGDGSTVTPAAAADPRSE
jgi:RNA polymerase sigma-70 factor (ECF subfamily)